MSHILRYRYVELSVCIERTILLHLLLSDEKEGHHYNKHIFNNDYCQQFVFAIVWFKIFLNKNKSIFKKERVKHSSQCSEIHFFGE